MNSFLNLDTFESSGLIRFSAVVLLLIKTVIATYQSVVMTNRIFLSADMWVVNGEHSKNIQLCVSDYVFTYALFHF